MLAVLTVRAGEVVPVDQLADALWGDDAPRSSAKVVQGCIGRLRRSLGTAAIETVPGGYRLTVDVDLVDAACFERLLRQARQLMTAGRPERAVDVLSEGLALWRGRPLVDLERWPPGCIEAARLGELRLEAEEDRLDAALAAGRHRDVVAEAQARAAEAPLREHRWVLLARAQHRCGRQGDALRTVHHARMLATEQGLDPGPELLAVEQLILASDGAGRATGSGAAAQAADELPPMLRITSALPFCGRVAETRALWDAWLGCRDGDFAVVLVTGEPGVGKTRLVSEMAVSALADGGAVLGGRCDEDLRVPFSPFVGALQWEIERSSPGVVGSRLGKYPGELVALVPETADLLPGIAPSAPADADTERQRLFRSVCSWLGASGVRAPKLLVLEDLHWADTGTVLLLRHVLRMQPGGLLVLATYRDTDVVASHPLTAAVADVHQCSSGARIPLTGLSRAGVRELVQRVRGRGSPEALTFADRVSSETAGNPLFVGEVLRHLAETDPLASSDGRSASDELATMGVHRGISEVIGRRVSRLHPATESMLRSAAVIGHDFDVGVLAAILDRPDGEVLDALEQAIAAALVVEVGVDQFRFAHALVRDTLHAELTASRRARAHRLVAEAVERRHADDLDHVAAVLALHWGEASGGGHSTVAAGWAERAAEHDLARRAPHEAAHWFGRALHLLGEGAAHDRARARLWFRLAYAQSRADDAASERSANAAARLAIDDGDLSTAVEALCLSTRMTFHPGQTPDLEKIALLDEILVRIGDEHPHVRGRLLAQLTGELMVAGELERQAQIIDELLRLIDATDDPCRRWALMSGGTVGECRRWADRPVMEKIRHFCREAAAHLPDSFERVRSQEMLWCVCAALADRDGCDEALAGVHREQTPHGQMTHRFLSLGTAFLDGRLEDCQHLLDEIDERLLQHLRQSEAAMVRFFTRFVIAREQGRLGEMLPLVGSWVHPGVATTTPGMRAATALIQLLTGHDARCAVATIDPAEIPDTDSQAPVVAWAAEAAAAAGSIDLVCEMLGRVEPFGGMNLVAGVLHYGSHDRLAALLRDRLGDHDLADAAFARAVHASLALRTPVWVARTELDWAASLAQRGCREAAQLHLRAGRSAIGDLPLTDSRQRADRLEVQLA